MIKHLIIFSVLVMMVFGFQDKVFSDPLTAEPIKKSTPTFQQKQQVKKTLEMPPAEVRNNKQACQEYCKKNGNCECEKGTSCPAGYKRVKRWSGVDKDWCACVKRDYGS